MKLFFPGCCLAFGRTEPGSQTGRVKRTERSRNIHFPLALGTRRARAVQLDQMLENLKNAPARATAKHTGTRLQLTGQLARMDFNPALPSLPLPAGGHLNNHWHVGDRKEGFMEGSILRQICMCLSTPALNLHLHVGTSSESSGQQSNWRSLSALREAVHLAQKSLSSPIPAEMFDGVQCVLRHRKYQISNRNSRQLLSSSAEPA